ncbi:MAG TPA: response regulator [Candidatus Rubrimentiphilum sp.]|nr:response regulator [Candidatus Rubrimentiphilum sp.]
MPARILVIDDNRTNLDLMTYLLRAFGHEPTGITDPTVALEHARASTFDAIISDILMPEIDGFSLARMFKTDPRLKDLPLIAVTALAMAGDRERVLAAGFGGYISKPIDPQTFVSQVDSFLPEALRGQHPDR